jgi:electron transport complex protein RnfG
MAKRESTFINMVLTLFIVAAISATTLGLMNEVTEEPIAAAKLKAKLEAVEKVVPEFDNDPATEMYILPSDLGDFECYPAKMGDKLVGTAISSITMKGFSGEIRVMVGLNPEGVIVNSSVLEHKETPGLGTKMNLPKFKDQFMGKNPAEFKVKVTKDGGGIDAITAATISSRAFCDAVARAYEAYMEGGQK